MTKEGFDKKLAELRKKQAELDEVYYDESDPYAFDGGCIMELHQLADEALALASGQILNEGDI
ncbi:hypothetical protein CBF86_01945 [Limosilactobacillus reuteri]|jgi:hypothetical protein|uniref:hypothetical protein n=1 Tax=Limosilactobacillus reuteri TaxID=1598 RepID=UPI000B9855AB|nr:hypothetical protein [Limosilactobacillus reuteri]MCR1863762.1 hypothetical protein [Limosilactobacillus reuteri]MCR1893358.1 hypothetical protein [Limosilactobacillus reuteri]NDO58023.1 hypothetical protein [Limosilactobacillus reuteri]OYS49828.1 hypothetical protein CBF86_01945 [Limosilactobacillus reuteri]OYS50713.1 hypothetical protein CBF84_02325 [Limosilactobacillus reuteri]